MAQLENGGKTLPQVPNATSDPWIERMRDDWDKRVNGDNLHWIAWHSSQDINAFFQQGEKDTIALIQPVFARMHFDPKSKEVLEIGCAIGRQFPGFQAVGFNKIWGVDIAPEMIAKGKKFCPTPGAQFFLNSGKDLSGIPNGSFDFCFSYNVFQHIPDANIIWKYFEEMHRVLRPGGIVQIHFRGSYKLKTRLLRTIPPRLRPALRTTFRLATLQTLRGKVPRGTAYPPGYLETWLGAAVPPGRMERRLEQIGFKDVRCLPDILFSGDGLRYWAVARKP